MAVVATAGTTDFGAIDPLPRDRRAVRSGTASGCTSTRRTAAGCWSRRRRRHLLDGIERADSVTVDYHKTCFQPVSSSALIVRDRPPRCGTSPGTPTTSTRNGWRAAHAQPGRQEPADHPPLRRAQALADAADHGRRPDRRATSTRSSTWPPRCTRAARRPTRTSRSPRRRTLSTLVFRYRPDGARPRTWPTRSTRGSAATLFAARRRRWSPAPRSTAAHWLKFTLLNPMTTARRHPRRSLDRDRVGRAERAWRAGRRSRRAA